MDKVDLTYLASAILLAQALGNSNREAEASEIRWAVANAEKLQEEFKKRRLGSQSYAA